MKHIPRKLLILLLVLMPLMAAWSLDAVAPLSDADLLKRVQDLGTADETQADDIVRIIDQALRDRSYQLEDTSALPSALLEVLGSTNSAIAAAASADFLVALSGQKQVASLREILHQAPHGLEAARVLAVIPGSQAREALLSGLDAPEEKTIVACLTALGNCKEKEAINTVKKLLKSQSAPVRRAALLTLGRIGGDEALETLLAHTRSTGMQDGVGNALLNAAASVEERSSRETLTFLLQKAQPVVQSAALTLMARRNPEIAFGHLLAALQDEASPLHGGALRALPLFKDVKNREALLPLLQQVSTPTAVSMLTHFQDYTDEPFREEVAKMATSPELDLRLAALETLGHIGKAKDLIPLAYMAREGEEAERHLAKEAMGRLDDPDLSDWVIQTIERGASLVQTPDDTSLSYLKDNPKHMARFILPELVELCRERRITDARPLVLELAQSKEREIRYLAVEALGEIGTENDVPRLLGYVQESKKSGYKKRCVLALGRILERSGSADLSEAILQTWSARPDPAFHQALLPLLVQIASTHSLNLIQEAAEREEANRLQREALKALGEWPDTTPLPYLQTCLGKTREGALHALALRSYMQLVVNIPNAGDQLIALRFAWDHAQNAGEKKSVLGGMGNLPGIDTLHLVLETLEEEAVMAEAAIAACQIVQALQGGEQAEPAKQALTKAYFASGNAQVRKALLQYGRSLLPVWAPERWEGDPFSGDYRGTLYNSAGETPVVGHLLATNFAEFRFILRKSFDAPWKPWAVLDGTREDDAIWLSGFGWEATIEGDTLEATLVDSTDRFVLKKVERLSPTLGKKPPEGAVVLFDGSGFDEWVGDSGEVTWTLAEGNAMEVTPQTGGIATRRAFGDMELHIEFRSPYSPGNPHQFYGNSGVFIQRSYEVQVLMSHGREPMKNDCGAFYDAFPPALNMCAPPLQWQTYDVTFRAARFDERGEKTENARVTVLHNGVVIHDDLELPGPSFENLTDPKEPTPLYLQDHHNRVQYRNIWVRELLPDPQCPPLEATMHQAPAVKSNAKPQKTDQTFRVALLQMMPEANDQQANLEKAEAFCRKAKEKDADLALMPEMWNVGYQGFWVMGSGPDIKDRWQAQAIPRDSKWVNHFRRLAKELNMAIGVTYLEAWERAPRNSLTIVDRHGQDLFTYAKMHTCDFADFEAATTPGEEFFVADLDTENGEVRLGSMICYDREFPESARLLMLKGAEVVVTPNACLLDDIRLAQFGTRALENSMGMAMTNYPAPFCGGRSVAYQVDGSQLTLAGPEEEIALVDFEMEHIRHFRQNSIWGDAFRRPHRYQGLIESEKLDVFKRNDAFGKPFEPEAR